MADDRRLFEETLEQRKGTYEGARIHSILDTSGRGTGYVNGVMVFEDEIGEEEDQIREYDPVALRRQVLDREAALAVTDALLGGESPPKLRYRSSITFSDSIRVTLGRPSGWPTRFGRRERFSDWPERVFRIEAVSEGRLNDLPQAKLGAPPLIDRSSVHDLWLPGDSGQLDLDNSGLYVVCPDYRISLRQITVDGEGLDVTWERHATFDGDLTIQASSSSRGVLGTAGGEASQAVSISLENLPEELYVFVIDEGTDVVLDWAQVHPYSLSQPSQIETELPSDTARDDIVVAENQTTELKGAARRGNRNDVIETMVGFSNAEGGRIYVGVDDDKEVLGVDDEARTRSRIESWYVLTDPRWGLRQPRRGRSRRLARPQTTPPPPGVMSTGGVDVGVNLVNRERLCQEGRGS